MATGNRSGPAALVVPLTLLAAWEALSATRLLALEFLPAPHTIAVALAEELRSGELATDTARTVGVTLAATTVAVTAGGVLGLALGRVRAAHTYLAASIDVLRTIPAVALVPVALLGLGPGPGTELLLAAYAATWPVVLSTAAGAATVPTALHDVARMLRLSRLRTIRTIVLPSVVPMWLAGARLSAVVALHVTVITEMITTTDGLGGGLTASLQGLNPPRMWAYALVCGLVGYLVAAALRRVARQAMPGAPADLDTAVPP
jgi:ABC-type nitrate/sulfonate/bicarbonate transport system permease component